MTDSIPDITQSSKNLHAFLKEKGFDVIIGIIDPPVGEKKLFIGCLSKTRTVRKLLKSYGMQWQTYTVIVERTGKPRAI